MNRYESARAMYAGLGVDTEQAVETLAKIPVSIHCWQGDDVLGFDGAEGLDGGIQTTGNYPGRARDFEELKQDLAKAFSLMPGVKRLNLHASYAVLGGDKGRLDRDAYQPRHFAPWVDFAKAQGLAGIDFNPTFFGHPRVKDGLTLSSPDAETRAFWVRHGAACRRIAGYLAAEMGSYSLVNVWVPDGYKDLPADRLSPRLRLLDSLDRVFADRIPGVVDAVESKVFGVGLESFTVGSNEFYQNYAARKGVCCLLDTGHYHPTELVSEKLSALLAFCREPGERVALHISRPVRWDSDHVVLFDDELRELALELVRCGALDRVLLGLDYFDASLNRVGAYVTGQRALQKALLYALLSPCRALAALQERGELGRLQFELERMKTLPFGDVWTEYLARQGLDEDWYAQAEAYEREVLSCRR